MIKISARIWNTSDSNKIALEKNDVTESIEIRKSDGRKVAVSGGELLFLALATCYRAGLYKEAQRRGITLEEVAVVVDGEFLEGRGAGKIVYRASVKSDATDSQLRDLLAATDRSAEVPNTLRAGAEVELEMIFDRA